MTEAIRLDYEASSESAIVHWEIPYSRLTDTTPTPTRPCEVTSLTDSTQLTGTILTIDAGDSVVIVDFTPSMVYYQEVRNVLTYDGAGAETGWGAINIGDEVYYDHGTTMLALGLQLSTSPLNAEGATNTRFGWVVARHDTDMALYPKGDATASTEEVGVMQLGAGSAAT